MSGTPGPPPAPAGLSEAVSGWLEALRTRQDQSRWLGPELALAATAQRLVEQDKQREGIVLGDGELHVVRVDAHEGGLVDLEATLVLPPDTRPGDPVPPGTPGTPGADAGTDAGADAGDDPPDDGPRDPRLVGELVIGLGAGYWEPAPAGTALGPDEWQLVDYVRDGRRASATWCVHPLGQDIDVEAGVAAVPQAITDDGRIGRVFLEVSNERDEAVVLSVGRPARPPGLFRRTPRLAYPELGLPVPAHGTVHVVGRTSRPRLTEVEIFLWDPVTRAQVAALRVPAELPKGHPGGDGVWCTDDADRTDADGGPDADEGTDGAAGGGTGGGD